MGLACSAVLMMMPVVVVVAAAVVVVVVEEVGAAVAVAVVVVNLSNTMHEPARKTPSHPSAQIEDFGHKTSRQRAMAKTLTKAKTRSVAAVG
jgi:hypothetical protein